MGVQIGDSVICKEIGVIGTVIKQYYPTSCSQQTMIRCIDGRRYRAPTNTFEKISDLRRFKIKI